MSGIESRKSAEVLWDALEEAVADPLVLAHCELELAVTLLLLRADMHDVASHARTAAELAEQVGETAVLGEALAIQAESEFLLGRPPTPAVRERALELEQSMDDTFPVVRPSSFFAYVDALADRRVRSLALRSALCACERARGREVARLVVASRRARRGVDGASAAGRAENRRGRGNRRSDRPVGKPRPGTRDASLLEAHFGHVPSARNAGVAAPARACRSHRRCHPTVDRAYGARFPRAVARSMGRSRGHSHPARSADTRRLDRRAR